MKLRTNSPRWFNEDKPEQQAKCVMFPASSDYDPWYPEDMEDKDSNSQEDAKAICLGTYDGRECPLLVQCLDFALANNERFGIWGGTTPEERVTMRKERSKKWQQSTKAGERN